MGESYSERDSAGAAHTRILLVQLLPGIDVDLLIAGLEAERATGGPGPADHAVRRDTELAPPERELHRVRTQYVRGEAVRMLQHAINNPLTALLAEAQMLELDPLNDEQRHSVERMVELARRLVALTRRLDAGNMTDPAGGPK
jgi:signal transduction histidine kinase